MYRRLNALLEDIRGTLIEGDLGKQISDLKKGQTVKVYTQDRTYKPWVGKVTKAGTKGVDLRGGRGGPGVIIPNVRNPKLFFLMVGGGTRMAPKSEVITRIEESALREDDYADKVQAVKDLLTKLGFKNLFIGKSGGKWIDISFDPPNKYNDPAYNIQKGKQLMYRELKKAGLLKKHRENPGALFTLLLP